MPTTRAVILLGILFLLAGVLFAIFIWPTPWSYHYDRSGKFVVRLNRLTGYAERLPIHGPVKSQRTEDDECRLCRGRHSRHTYASLALQRGVPLLVVSRQLGHASIAITADIYGHLVPDATREAAEAWEAILDGASRNPRATPETESS